jgi:antitoxin (DNA-binding transcriptional repressor) of toxin-antitoxin stability system
MVKQYNMHEAKTNFSKLAQMVEAGEEVVIARNGVPVMKMVLIEDQVRPPRDFSKLKGLISYVSPEDWEAMDAEILAAIVYRDLDV